MLLDAAIVFFPDYFRACPSLPEAKSYLEEAKKIDFDLGFNVPPCWAKLREEARERILSLAVFKANLEQMQP